MQNPEFFKGKNPLPVAFFKIVSELLDMPGIRRDRGGALKPGSDVGLVWPL